jgi:hypothetical protein
LFAGPTPLILWRDLLDFDIRESLGPNRASPQGLAAGTRMKIADLLDVAAFRDLAGHDRGGLMLRAAIQPSRLRLHTQKIINNDRFMIVRLSKIAHMAESSA